MEALCAPFSAGTPTWFKHGPSHHAPRRYDRIKVSVLLGSITSKWRPSPYAAWQLSLPGSTSLCATGQGAEVEFGEEGQLLALQIDPDFIGRPGSRTPPPLQLPDLHGVRDSFLFALFTEAAATLQQRAGELPAGYAESVARLAGERL